MNLSELVRKSLKELQDLMLSKTVVGDPIQAEKHTLIPVSKVMFGFGSGGGENKTVKNGDGFGQGIAGGWSIEPVAFIVVGPDGAQLLPIGEKITAVSKLIDLAPKVVDAVKEMVEKKTDDSTETTAKSTKKKS